MSDLRSALVSAIDPAWQDQYAAPDWRERLTRLDPAQEVLFRMWSRLNHIPLTSDYDMRGYWQHRGEDGSAAPAVNPNDGQPHYPDTWKTPLHATFSGESVYANPQSNPPRWNDHDQLVAHDGRILFDDRARRR